MSCLLFSCEHQNKIIYPEIEIGNKKLKIQKFKIGKNCKLYIFGETKSIKTTLSRLIFMIMTLGKSYIYYCTDDTRKVVHTSYVIPKCIKFPFLMNDDYEIGPCMTIHEYRGRGIYPQVLNYITYSCGGGDTKFYMLVNPTNKSSIKGIKKANFKLCEKVIVTKLRQYRKIEDK